MPLIDLSNIDPRISGSYVWSLMHYPDDEYAITSYMNSTLLSSFTAYECDKCNDSTNCACCRDYAELFGKFTGFAGGPGKLYDALFSRQRNKMTGRPKDRHTDGLLSGKILLYAMNYNESITKAIQKVFHYHVSPKINSGRLPPSYTEDHLANNVWNRQKEVAHFWAAFHNFKQIESNESPGPNYCFPFYSESLRKLGWGDDLACFLWRAETIREICSKQVPKRRGPTKTLLDADTTYSLILPWDWDRITIGEIG